MQRASDPTGLVLRLEWLGAVFMVACGSALHFAFDWTGGWHPVALVAAVNESIWEHLKLAFWPGVLWMVIAPYPAHLRFRRLLAAKGIGLLVCAVTIIVVFQSYSTALGHNLLVLDIGIFVLAIVLGQLISGWVLIKAHPMALILGLPAFALQLAAYSLFTYAPPNYWLFTEHSSGIQGIPAP